MLRRVNTEQGFTVAELLVGMAVGLLVLLAVTSVYITVLRGSSGTLDATRLNQEMSAIMNIMVNDIRRAGYWQGAANAFNTPHINPFNGVETASAVGNITAIRVHSNGGDPAAALVDVTYDADGKIDRTPDNNVSDGSCITYTYDHNNDNTVDNDDEFGFRWKGAAADALMMRTSNADSGANNCDANSGNWESINDVNEIVITDLHFDLGTSSCRNASEPDSLDDDADGEVDSSGEFDCYAVVPTVGATPGDGSGDSTVEVLTVTITLTAQLTDDPQVRSTLVQSVTPRNNLIRLR